MQNLIEKTCMKYTIRDLDHIFVYTNGKYRCKYCCIFYGFYMDNVRFKPCISDDEKIIKDILE